MCSLEAENSALSTQHSALKLKRLGIFGGSFNPIHNGHLTIASQVRERLQLDRILFIPTGEPPHKQDGALASAKDRYEMVRLAIAGTPSFDVSDIEVQRRGKSFSIDTIRELQRQHGPGTKLYFLIGLDAFLDFPTWKEPQALLNACRFVVISRPGQVFQSLARLSMLPRFDPHALSQLDTGEMTRFDIAIPSCPGIICLPLPPSAISASDIRQRLQRKAALANELPPPVESYILQHHLYQEDRDHKHI
jgi:nicotinate-nucleotide adenylyltransferase